MVFLLNRPPSKTIGGDTSYDRTFGKHVDLFFLWTIGTRPHGDRQLRGTPDLLISYSSRSKHLAIRFMGLRDWIIDEKLVIDLVSTEGQLSDILAKFLARFLFIELLNAIIKDQLRVIYLLKRYFWMY